jgi:DNA-directed RNA polymerase subunit beta
VRVYDEDRNEVELKESVDYTESDYKAEIEGDRKYDNREKLEGYQQKEFDSISGDLVDADDDFDDDDFADDDFDDDDDFSDDLDDLNDSFNDDFDE